MSRLLSLTCALLALTVLLSGVLVPVWTLRAPRPDAPAQVLTLVLAWAALSLSGRGTELDTVITRLLVVFAVIIAGLWLWLIGVRP